jgi:hypothetical protein
MVETKYFTVASESLGISFNCYALSYADKTLGINGYYEFGVDKKEYTDYFLNKYGCELKYIEDEECGAFLEELMYLLAEEISQQFGVEVEENLNEYDKYFWELNTLPTMNFSLMLDEYADYFGEEE